MCVTSILSSICIGGLSYWFQKQHVIAEAKVRSSILLDYTNASSAYFEHSQKPLINALLLDNDKFYPELSNGFMVLREFANLFEKNNSGHSFHLASLNPLNDANIANSNEKQIINHFRSQPALKKKDGLIKQNGELIYYTSAPIKIKTSCLTCHDKPENAPRTQIVLYGTDNGYGWQAGETIAATFIYVSLQQSMQDARNNAIKIFFISFACFLLTFLVIILL
jgi:hypothetical protein